MAITSAEYEVLSDLRRSGELPRRAALLELGDSNWYGDVPIARLRRDVESWVKERKTRDRMLARLTELARGGDPVILFEIAKIFLAAVCDTRSLEAIDPGTPISRYRFDLNHPVPLRKRYDIVLNAGTAEHIFNVCQFFKTTHELTRPGGLMIHGAPFRGWVEHGFFNFQPTLFRDLAAQNGYSIVDFRCVELSPFRSQRIESREHLLKLAADRHLGEAALLYATFRKAKRRSEFRIPMQGIYAGTVSLEVKRAWFSLR